ncbi:MAG TPA: 3-hydroxyacyl-ACP dehydratase FabZ family protein [Opitutaceae bacterium]|nr:3-hydroxyacyl-ACP dehydratase FabZ family protein [Opitutaceae bacterium]
MEPIEKLIPHRPPFLFVDEIIAETDDTLTTRRRVRPDEDFFKGHYPGNPIMPGVLICESVFQSGCIFLTKQLAAKGGDLSHFTPVLTRIIEVKFKNSVKPGDELIIDVKLKDRLGRFMFMTGSVRTADNRKVLTVDFGVALVETSSNGSSPPAAPAAPAP